MNQPALPGFDMRPACSACGKPAGILGQYSPIWPIYVCRACSLREPYRLEVLAPATERSSKTGQRDGFVINPAARSDLLEWRIVVEGRLRDAVRGCKLARGNGLRNESLPCWHGRHVEPGCKLCARRLGGLYSGAVKYMRYRGPEQHQLSLPVCERCGKPHDRGGFVAHCQRCEDELAVEALWRLQSIFGDDAKDVETLMDRLYKAQRPLFDRGVLPDYWFKLMESKSPRTVTPVEGQSIPMMEASHV